MNQNFNSEELIKYCKKGELYRVGLNEDKVISEINIQESKILNQTFRFDIKSNNEYYFVNSIQEKLLLRKLNDNIKRIYKDEQANRKFIIQQIKTLLAEDAPFWIIKTDIKSFYESIKSEKILRKLKNDAMLSFYSIFLLETIFKNSDSIAEKGLPRGLNISSTLSEIYLRNFDKWVTRSPNVYYYARFVDDIIIFLSNKASALLMFESLNERLKEICSLEVNDNKTELIEGGNFRILRQGVKKRPVHNKIEYLGYKFFLENSSDKRIDRLRISIADKKVKKIKTRITQSYVDFVKNSDFDLLKMRIKFLTGNYGISKSNDGSVLKAGIHYNYSHINYHTILKELNDFHRKIIYSKRGNLGIKLNSILTVVNRNYLKKHCFLSGYKNKTYDSFTYAEMGSIIKCWK